MAEHPAIENLQEDIAMATLHNPHEPGTPESEAYHQHLVEASKPQNMHRFLGSDLSQLVAGATKASALVQAVVNTSHDERLYDQSVTSRYS